MKKLLLALLVPVLVVGVLAVGYRLFDRTRWAEGQTELFVFGVDGADWHVIDPLLARGEMPNLEALIARGVRAELRSIHPMLSPRIWTTVASGKLPEKHGVKDFLADSRIVRSRRLWNLLDEEGWSVGMFGYPITWPPEEVDGFMVPDWMARGNETHPPELSFLRQMESNAKAQVDPGLLEHARNAARSWSVGVGIPTLARSATYVVGQKLSPDPWLDRYHVLRELQSRLQTDAFVGIYRRYHPRFAVYYTDIVDKVSHQYWKYYEPDAFESVDAAERERYGDVIETFYRRADEILGRLLGVVDEDATVLVLSDHGFQATGSRGQEALVVDSGALLDELGLGGEVRVFKLSTDLYMRTLDSAGPEVAARLERARRALEEAVYEPTGEPAFFVEDQPDGSFMVRIRKEVRVEASRGPVRLDGRSIPILDIADAQKYGGGTHREMGIFVMSCARCRAGEEIGTLDVADVTPTLLHLLGMPVGRDMDGRVALEVFAPELARTPIEWIDTHDHGMRAQTEQVVEDPAMIEQLRAVGYVE